MAELLFLKPLIIIPYIFRLRRIRRGEQDLPAVRQVPCPEASGMQGASKIDTKYLELREVVVALGLHYS